MTYTDPTSRAYGAKITATQDWNVLVNDIKDHQSRLTVVEAWQAAHPIPSATNAPIGGIILWSGSVASIPAGWHLCDGGTYGGIVSPDLRDNFVIGAGSTYAVDATGGTASHAHATVQTASGGSHTHSLSGTTGSPSSTSTALSGGTSVASSGHTHTFGGTTGSGGSHTHWTGASDTVSHLPPYYALAYIMRYV